ncbi:hypothetical protein SBF1_2620011 [Candidatus Desulfosporosinus infrequens]|uniref:Uncharacterized protein n=1 Tax=Candidatus Desulfosporosinus infrequens TaxID=2043169 RepID=A0A2U3KRW0_9FIRM|nr:hypothetical protein SBF1_2620011 [Candidatus Desulfosporosinus infrequens]
MIGIVCGLINAHFIEYSVVDLFSVLLMCRNVKRITKGSEYLVSL